MFASSDDRTIGGARDKALIAVMLFCFARIGAVLKMRVSDYRGAGTNAAALELHEKGGKFHRVPAHHRVVEALEVYLELAGLRAMPEAPLWQSSLGKTGKLAGSAMSERAALKIIKRRCKAAGMPADISNHSFVRRASRCTRTTAATLKRRGSSRDTPR